VQSLKPGVASRVKTILALNAPPLVSCAPGGQLWATELDSKLPKYAVKGKHSDIWSKPEL